ncbi:MAG: VOC family protein [Anaerolineae bacterium]
MTSIEVHLVVSDCVQALAFYERVFGAQRGDVTRFKKGFNECSMTLGGTTFRLFDENPAYQFVAPREGTGGFMWMDLSVDDVDAVFHTAVEAGCTVVQELVDHEQMGVRQGIVADPFGYIWFLDTVVRVVSFEERCRILAEQIPEAVVKGPGETK